MERTESLQELIEKSRGEPPVVPATYLPPSIDYTTSLKVTESESSLPELEYISSPKAEASLEFIEKISSTTLDPFVGINCLPLDSVKFNKNKKEDFLGKGAFGQVYRGEWNKRPVALKEIDIEQAQQRLGLSEEEVLEALQWEVSRLSTVNHPNLVQFYGLYREENNPYLVIEYCEGGDLKNALAKTNPDWSKRWQWALEITQGLLYLHHQGMLHRDLKAENILIDSHHRARLADLGVAQVDTLLQKTEARVVFKGLQDWRFAAPEALIALSQEEHISTRETDIYALGLVFWQLVSGKEPRRADSNQLLAWMKTGEREPIPENCPKEFRELILACWTFEPSKRPKIEEILKHLNQLSLSSQAESHWMNLCQQMDVFIHPKRVEGLSYIPSLVTEHQIQEDLDVYWQKLETLETKKVDKEEGNNSNSEKPSLIEAENSPLKLQPIFAEFLENPQSSTLLLLGEAGLGKTLSTYQLADELLSQWWQYLANSKSLTAPYFPIFVRPTLTRWSYSELKGGLEKALKSYVLQTSLDLKEARLLVIVDGYDQCQADEEPRNLPEQLGIKNLPHIKLLVTCRPNTVELTDLLERFALNSHLTVRHFLPFNVTQLLDYLNQGLHWDSTIYQRYQEKFQESPPLRAVLRNPFVASLLLQSWETIKKKDFDRLNRRQIYQGFVEHWIYTHYSLLSPTIQKTLTVHCKSRTMLERLLESFNAFGSEIAFQAFQRGTIAFDKKTQEEIASLSKTSKPWFDLKGEIIQDSERSFQRRQEKLTKEGSRRALLSQEDYASIMQWRLQQFEAGSPLKDKGFFFEFSHKSFFEYFVARRIIELRENAFDSIVEEGLELLNHRLIQTEPEAVVFLVEGWQEDKTRELIEPLFRILDYSKQSEFTHIQASANAATILNVGRVSFSNKNLSNIKIPYADLRRGIFDHTNFQHANLTGVQLQNAWLRGADLQGANLTEVQFGEKPYLLHDDPVQQILYSPDGRWMATTIIGMSDNITLWDAISGERRHVLKGHISDVECIAFSPDGLILASASNDTTCKLWEVKSGKELYTLKGHTDTIRSIAFSPNGLTLASGSFDKTCKLWEVKSGKELHSLERHTAIIRSMAFSPDGLTLASGSKDTTCKLWEVKSGRELYTLKGHTKEVESIAFSPDGLTLASGSDDTTCKLWEVKSGRELYTLKGHTKWVHTIVFSSDGLTLASASNDTTCKLWEVKSGRELYTLKSGSVHSIVFSPDSLMFASSGNTTCKLWEVKSGRELYILEGHTKKVNSIAFSPDGLILASGSFDGTCKFWEVKRGRTLYILEGHTEEVHEIAFSLDGLTLASASNDTTCKLWEVKSGRELYTLKSGSVYSIAFSPNGLMFASSGNTTCKLWEVKNGRELYTLKGHIDPIWNIAFSRDGLILASGSEDTTCKLWEVKSGKELYTLKGHTDSILSIAFSPDGLILASGSHDTTCKLWEVKSGKELHTLKGHRHSIWSIAFSPDGLILASGSHDTTCKLWEVKSGKELHTLKGHTEAVHSMAFSPDGLILASGSRDNTTKLSEYALPLTAATLDNTCKLWEVKSGKELYTLKGHTDSISGIAFSPDGLTLVTGSDNTCKLWDIATGQLLFNLGGYFGRINTIAWNQDVLVTGSSDNSVKCWKIQRNSDNTLCTLLWSSHPSLYAEDCKLNQSRLSPLNTRLLKQKGAIGFPLITVSGHPDWNALHMAVANNHQEGLVQSLQEQPTLLNGQTDEGETPLHMAVRYHSVASIEYLLNQGANVWIRNLQGQCPGNLAVDLGQRDLLDYLPIEDKENLEQTPLHLAIENGFGRVVAYLLKQRELNEFKSDMNAFNHQDQTPLLLAIAKNNNQIVKLLLEKGAEPNKKNKVGKTAIHVAVSNNQLEILILLKAYGADLLAKDNQGNTPLHQAVTAEQVKILEWLLEQGVSVDLPNKAQLTPLESAANAKYPKEEVIELLLEKGADPNTIRLKGGNTLLHWAAKKGHPRVLELLLNAKMNIEIRNDVGKTAFHSAARGWRSNEEQIERLKLLKKYGADLLAKDNQGNTPLHRAVTIEQVKIPEWLLEQGVPVDLPNKAQLTPLESAANVKYPKEEVIELLLEKGADPNTIRLKGGNTLLHWAAKKGHPRVLELLLNAKMDIEIRNGAGETAAHSAVVGWGSNEAQIKILKLLKKHGADLLAKDNQGDAPLHRVVAAEQAKILEWLEDPRERLELFNKYGPYVRRVIEEVDLGSDTPLHQDVAVEQVKILEWFLKQGVHIDLRNKKQLTPLELAAKAPQKGIIELLLEKGANPNAIFGLRLKRGDTLLHWATKKGYLRILELLLNANMNIEMRNDDGETAAHVAIHNSQLEILKLLRKYGADLLAKDNQGDTPLHQAVTLYEGVTDKRLRLLYLSEQEISRPIVNARLQGSGFLEALVAEPEKILEWLLEQGISVDLPNKAQLTPLALAVNAKYPNEEAIELLLEKVANPNAIFGLRLERGDTLLHWAAKKGYPRVLELLLNNMNVEIRNDDGETAAHVAAYCNQVEILKILKARGADLLAKDKIIPGGAPLHRAAATNQVQAVEWLLKQGIFIDLLRDDGCTPLHRAAYNGCKEVVELLLQRGASTQILTQEGKTPAKLARENNQDKIVNLIQIKKYLVLSDVAIDKNNLKEAIFYYKKIIELNPQLQSVRHNLACYYFAQAVFEKDPELSIKAEECFQQAMELGHHSGVCTDYANFLFFHHRYEEVISLLLEAIKLKGDNKELGYGQLDKNSIPEELKVEVNEQGSVSVKAVIFSYYLLILTYQRVNQLNQAIALLPEYSEEVKRNGVPLSYSLLGYSHKVLGLFNEAAGCFDKAYQLKSDYLLAKQNQDECLHLAKNLAFKPVSPEKEEYQKAMEQEVINEQSTYCNDKEEKASLLSPLMVDKSEEKMAVLTNSLENLSSEPQAKKSNVPPSFLPRDELYVEELQKPLTQSIQKKSTPLMRSLEQKAVLKNTWTMSNKSKPSIKPITIPPVFSSLNDKPVLYTKPKPVVHPVVIPQVFSLLSGNQSPVATKQKETIPLMEPLKKKMVAVTSVLSNLLSEPQPIESKIPPLVFSSSLSKAEESSEFKKQNLENSLDDVTQLEIAVAASLETYQQEQHSFASDSERKADLERFQKERKEELRIKKGMES